ncbi:glycoside hydrolase [Bacteroidia bacterium]|nr:glycoside hydrolase [Bacteroidia bacterium]
MKRITLLLSAFIIAATAFAQQPQRMDRPVLKRNSAASVEPRQLQTVERQSNLDDFDIAMRAAWKKADGIVEDILMNVRPIFEKKVITINIKDAKDATKVINKAIVDVNKAGGGKVIIPQGEFYTAGITLLSNVNLHLEEGAVLKFFTDPQKYLPAVLTAWEGLDCYNLRPLIYAYQQENIAITGTGTLDGQASNDNWWAWKSAKVEGKLPRQILDDWCDANVPIEKRILNADNKLRPPFIQPYQCKNVLIEGVTINRSPFWLIHPLMCEYVIVRGVKMDSNGPNSDGCDPESSKNVLIEDCYFNTGDDCIAIKSGRNDDGRRRKKASGNIVIRNCEMKDGHGGVVIGSEISGDCQNVYVEKCTMDSENLDRVIRIKSNAVRGGVIEGLYVRNIKVGACKEAVLRVEMKYEKVTEGKNRPIVRDIYLENISSKSSQYAIYLDGFKDGGKEISNINLKNCSLRGIQEPSFNKIIGALDVNLIHCSFGY